jgi:hypothetical protein
LIPLPVIKGRNGIEERIREDKTERRKIDVRSSVSATRPWERNSVVSSLKVLVIGSIIMMYTKQCSQVDLRGAHGK